MRSLFVMDPLDRINAAGDSTYVTMRECSDRGFEVAMTTPDRLFVLDGRTAARVTPVRTTAEPPWFVPPVGGSFVEQETPLDAFDIVWMRKDPPFDMTYVFATYLLAMVKPPTVVVNDPRGLALYNEKMWVVAQWPELQPATLVTNDLGRLRAFVKGQPGRSVLKPWAGNGGRGVVVTSGADRNLPSLCEILSNFGQDYVIAQAYVEEVERGDKRIVLYDGEPVAAMLRVPHATDFRANMHAGGYVEPCGLDPRDLQICEAIGPALKAAGMLFVGIDVIGPYLTEINVTSPTGLRELNRLYGSRLEADLVDRAAEMVAASRRGA
jgi:glutathione synthase